MGGKSEVSHVVQDQKIVLVLGKGLHQGRHPEIVFLPTVYVPGGRVNAIGLEEGHEPHGGIG